MSIIEDAVEFAVEWAPRVLRLIPVFRDLWDGVKEDDQAKIFAAQMEMQRQMRRAQAMEEFVLDDPDEAP